MEERFHPVAYAGNYRTLPIIGWATTNYRHNSIFGAIVICDNFQKSTRNSWKPSASPASYNSPPTICRTILNILVALPRRRRSSSTRKRSHSAPAAFDCRLSSKRKLWTEGSMEAAMKSVEEGSFSHESVTDLLRSQEYTSPLSKWEGDSWNKAWSKAVP